MVKLQKVLNQQYSALILVCFTIFMDNLLLSMITPIIPYYMNTFGASQSQVGMLFAIDAAGLLFSTPLWGIISDRYGRKIPILFGLVGLIISTVFLGFGNNLIELYIARLMQGISSAATWTSGLALLADIFPSEERGKSMGILMTSASAASLLGAPVGGFLFEYGGIHFPFLIAAGLIILNILGFVFFLKFPSIQPQEKISIKKFLKNPNVIIICIIVLVGDGALAMIDPILPTFLSKSFAASPTVIGLLFAVATVAYGISSYISGYISDKTNKYAVMIAGLILISITYPFIILSKTLFQEFIAVFFVGASVGIALTPTLSAISDIVDLEETKSYALAYAIFDIFFALGILLGPIIGGSLADLIGIKYTIFGASGFIALFALSLVFIINIFTKKAA